MSTQEQKQEIIKKIERLSDLQINQLWDFLQKNSISKTEKYIDDAIFEHLLNEDAEKYKEVWKILA